MTPSQPHTLYIDPFLGSGTTPGGLYVELHASYPPVLAHVLAAHPTVTSCAPGDVILFHPYSYADETNSYGHLCVLHEDNILAVVEDYDVEQ